MPLVPGPSTANLRSAPPLYNQLCLNVQHVSSDLGWSCHARPGEPIFAQRKSCSPLVLLDDVGWQLSALHSRAFWQHACRLSHWSRPACSLGASVLMCRAMLLGGDFFLGAILAAALTKLVLRLRQLGSPPTSLNKGTAQVQHIWGQSKVNLHTTAALGIGISCTKLASGSNTSVDEVAASQAFV